MALFREKSARLSGEAGSQASGRPADPLRAGLLEAPVGLLMLDEAGVVRFASRRLELALGIEGLAGRRLAERVEGAVPPSGPEHAATTALRASDGRLREVVWTRNPAGGWTGVLAGAGVESPAARSEAGNRDELTGLGNLACLRAAFDAWTASGPCDAVALYLDLDHFGRASELLGQRGSQALLKRVAQRLRQVARASDVLARLERDKFAILSPAAEGREAMADMAARLVDVLSRPYVIAGRQVATGGSVGLAARAQGDGSLDDLLRLASVAMQHARAKGYGRVLWFDQAMGEAIRLRHFIETGLRRALVMGEFEVHYQPQFDIDARRISGFEALIRWRHPEQGLIAPGAFIPVAEQTGLMPEIGAWVLREACAAAARWDGGLTIAVNVSPLQFERGDFVGLVEGALAGSGLEPERLELELTEALLLSDTPETIEKMRRLRARGVRLALDDFGIGYASLNYLRRFPFDKIKLDQSFVRGPSADRTALGIIAAVAQMGEALGMTVLAEGVETEGQLENLRQRGCAGAQGYLFSRPIPQGAVADFIASFSAPGLAAGAGGAEEEAEQ